MEPTISVIIPIYNADSFLKDCVDSMLHQISDRIEIILVNDGSTDTSPKICDKYAQLDHRIKVVHKENGGLVSARKAGAAVACGKYIATQDADDWFDGHMFEKVLGIIDTYAPDLIHFDSIKVVGDVEIEMHSNLRVGMYYESDIQNEIFPILIEDENSRIFKNSITSNVIKSELYKSCQYMVDDAVKIGEDFVCTKPIIYRSKSMYIMSDCLGRYRINPESMTKGHNPYDLNYPLLIGEGLEKGIDISKYDFREQLARCITHNVFNACVSRFYGKKPYREVVKEINECLKDPYYSNMIKICKYSKKNLKANLMRFSLRYKCYFLMKLYCISNFKGW